MWTINLAQSSERERFTSVLYYCATQAVWGDFLTLFYRPSCNECVIFSLAAFWSERYISASVVTASILSYFGFPSLSFTKSAGSVSVAGPLKLRWFSHPIQYYPMCLTFLFTVGVRILWTSLRVGSKREQSQVIYLVYLLYEVIILFKHLSRNLTWKLRVPIQTMLFYSIRTVGSTLNLGHLCSILQNFALIGLLH